MLFLKGFLVLSDLLKPAFEKSSKKKFWTNLAKQIISAYCIKVFA